MRISMLFGTLLAALIAFSGCGKVPAVAVPAGTEKVSAEHTHEGWWCVEHGVPESDCAQCDAKIAAKYKAKGDWCAKHDRPESQCFICHPEFAAKFAAIYEAKEGRQPPKPTME